jgi:putative glutathione S-transferase
VSHLSPATRLASPADPDTHGEYHPGRPPHLRFHGRITDDGTFTARPSRYHVYGGRFCPCSHRIAIVRELCGLHDVVTMSYVDGQRDGRGWAFRRQHGPDPVNGFPLLRQAYEATEENYDGHVSVPVLWDRFTASVVSNDPDDIVIDVATRFPHLACVATDLYPAALRDRIDELDRRFGPAVGQSGDRDTLLEAFEMLDARLSGSRYLLGDALTLADVRLWVRLVRYDAGPNARRTLNPGLHVYPHLWGYARDLYRMPAFRDTTDFSAFTEPGARLPDWTAHAERPAGLQAVASPR